MSILAESLAIAAIGTQVVLMVIFFALVFLDWCRSQK